MATTADIKNGMVIEFNNNLFSIIDFQHVKPGKGPAFVRTKLKSIKTGKVIANTFTSGVKLNVARVERRGYQYLYNDDSGYHFMDTQTYEQTFIKKELINAPDLLKEGQEVEIMVHVEQDEELSCELPPFVDLEVAYAEPGVKGDTATNTLKPAKMETGATVNVPLFINEGEKIRIDTRTGNYSERVKQ